MLEEEFQNELHHIREEECAKGWKARPPPVVEPLPVVDQAIWEEEEQWIPTPVWAGGPAEGRKKDIDPRHFDGSVPWRLFMILLEFEMCPSRSYFLSHGKGREAIIKFTC